MLLNQTKQRWCREEVVLDNMQVFGCKVKDLGLAASAAVNQTMQWLSAFLEEVDHHWSISSRG